MKKPLDILLQELHDIVNSAGHEFNQALFIQQMQAIQQAVSEKQAFLHFVQYHSNGLEISMPALEAKTMLLNNIVLSPQHSKQQQILAMYNLGHEILLTKALLLLTNQSQLDPSKQEQIYLSLQILKNLSNFNYTTHVEHKALECLCICAWHVEEFWFMQCMVNLNLHFYQSVELKKARDIAYQSQNFATGNMLSQLVSPPNNHNYIKIQHEALNQDIHKLTKFLHQQKHDSFYYAQLFLARNAVNILLKIGQICCPVTPSIATHEEYLTRATIDDLTILSSKINHPQYRLNNEDMQVLSTSAVHFREIWLIESMLAFNLIAINPFLEQEVINYRAISLNLSQQHPQKLPRQASINQAAQTSVANAPTLDTTPAADQATNQAVEQTNSLTEKSTHLQAHSIDNLPDKITLEEPLKEQANITEDNTVKASASLSKELQTNTFNELPSSELALEKSQNTLIEDSATHAAITEEITQKLVTSSVSESVQQEPNKLTAKKSSTNNAINKTLTTNTQKNLLDKNARKAQARKEREKLKKEKALLKQAQALTQEAEKLVVKEEAVNEQPTQAIDLPLVTANIQPHTANLVEDLASNDKQEETLARKLEKKKKEQERRKAKKEQKALAKQQLKAQNSNAEIEEKAALEPTKPQLNPIPASTAETLETPSVVNEEKIDLEQKLQESMPKANIEPKDTLAIEPAKEESPTFKDLKEAVDKLDDLKIMKIIGEDIKHCAILDKIIANKYQVYSLEFAIFLSKIYTSTSTCFTLLSSEEVAYKNKLALANKILDIGSIAIAQQYLSENAPANIQEFTKNAPLTPRTCFILLKAENVPLDIKTILIKRITKPNYPINDYFPFNKIFNITAICCNIAKQLADKSEQYNLVKLVIDKEKQIAHLINDPSEHAMHYLMRHMPSDFEIFNLIIDDYQNCIIAKMKANKSLIPIHPTNNKQQNFLHVLAEHPNHHDISQTLANLQDFQPIINSAIVFKDARQLSPMNVLELRQDFPLEAIEWAEQNLVSFLVYLFNHYSKIPIPELKTFCQKDFYGNNLEENIIKELYQRLSLGLHEIENLSDEATDEEEQQAVTKLQDPLKHMLAIIHHRSNFRMQIFTLITGMFNEEVHNIAIAHAAKPSQNTATTNASNPAVVNFLLYHWAHEITNFLGNNEYGVVKIDNTLLINKIFELSDEEKNPYANLLDPIKKSEEFKELVKAQALTESYIWACILQDIKARPITKLDEIESRLNWYINNWKTDPSLVDSQGYNLLDKFILLGNSLKIQGNNLRGIKLCCEKINIPVEAQHLIRQTRGHYQNPQYSLETLDYLLTKFNDKSKALAIGQENDQDLLVYAALDAKDINMIKHLIQYGFNVDKKYKHLQANILILILNAYCANLINEQDILPILNTLLDNTLVPSKLQSRILNHSDDRGLISLGYALYMPRNYQQTNEAIINLLINKGADIIHAFTHKNPPFDLNLMVRSEKLNTHMLKYLFTKAEEKQPGFVREYLKTSDKKGKTIFDKISHPFPGINDKPPVDTIELIKSYEMPKNKFRI